MLQVVLAVAAALLAYFTTFPETSEVGCASRPPAMASCCSFRYMQGRVAPLICQVHIVQAACHCAGSLPAGY